MAKQPKDRKTTPGAKSRKTKQRKVKRYSKLRTELQELDVLPISAEGAVKSEVVDPSTQGEQIITSIPLRAASEGWATPGEKKVRVVDELVQLVETPVASKENDYSGVPAVVKVMAANALGKLDQIQHERDHPETKVKSDTNVNVQVNTNLWQPIFQPQGQVRDEVEERLKQLETEQSGELDGRVEEGGPAKGST